MTPLRILYRGPLESCNFDCDYCPFGKVELQQDQLDEDFAALERFVAWAVAQPRPLAVFFTPWGEALIHEAYQQAIATLSCCAHVERVVIQTNLSCGLSWLSEVDPASVALWVTWHPGWTPLERLLRRCARLRSEAIRHSVGIVGEREHFTAIVEARAALPPQTYLWINADRHLDPPYSDAELDWLATIDPCFPDNVAPWPSRGQPCDAGHRVITVDGGGIVRRCHFVSEPIGSLEQVDDTLAPRACPNESCRCHIGYVHLPSTGLAQLYGSGILERIPGPQWAGWGTLEALVANGVPAAPAEPSGASGASGAR
ncbi:MAG TPA: radical SAM protein [Deltaproteobacteria bacterium]|nr:radical SAM protein [Deltaproteobacteria bacterium]